MSQDNADAQLISSGCTTGWGDWLWGELWLLPEGLLRRSCGWKGLVAAVTLGSIAAARPGAVRRIDPEEIPGLLAKRGRNRWIPRDQIAKAVLRKGLVNGRLNVWLSDGTRVKFLWLTGDPVYEVLQPVLDEWLGDRLTLQ